MGGGGGGGGKVARTGSKKEIKGGRGQSEASMRGGGAVGARERESSKTVRTQTACEKTRVGVHLLLNSTHL